MHNSAGVSLTRAAVWLPETCEDAGSIGERCNLPEQVVREKLGIHKKRRAPNHVHPSEMAVKAGQKVLRGIDPLSVDLVIWTGSEYKDYPVWSAGIFVQEILGLRRAWSFDLAARCSTTIVGLRVARDLMRSDTRLNRVLLVGGHRTGDLVNYGDPATRFLFNLADGGAAILLERGEDNPIMESAIISDGEFSTDVIIPAGGTRNPTRSSPEQRDTFLTVPNVVAMRERLENRSIPNFLTVIREAAIRSMPERPIDYLALLHMKRSAHEAILNSLELELEKSIYLEEYGHFGAPDQVLSLGLAERCGKLKPGSHVVLAAAGIGYIWSAISIRWDRPLFME